MICFKAGMDNFYIFPNSSQPIYTGYIRYTLFIYAIYCQNIRLAATLLMPNVVPREGASPSIPSKVSRTDTHCTAVWISLR
jgi:hypothetical protein